MPPKLKCHTIKYNIGSGCWSVCDDRAENNVTEPFLNFGSMSSIQMDLFLLAVVFVTVAFDVVVHDTVCACKR